MDKQQSSLQKAKTYIKVLGSISLILAPLLSLIGWGISYDSFTSLFSFNFSYQATNGAAYLTANTDPALVFRYYLLPHYFMYASMPVYIALGLTLMYATYKKTPWLSFIGAILSIIGAVYFIGVLGAYLSAPIGSVAMTNILKVSFALCILVFVGNVLLGLSLYKANITAKWTSLLFIFGNILILVFPGIENWMALGSLMMLIAMLPLTKIILKRHP
tara:strand:- start:1985 stop:2635 length:651 start_codon:yes stop_codon:yes gene_type:complete